MATDSEFDSYEFDKKIIRHFPSENGLAQFSSQDSSAFCERGKNCIYPSGKLGSKSSKSGTEIRYNKPLIYPDIFEIDDNCGDHVARFCKHQFCHSSAQSEPELKQGPLTDGISLLSIDSSGASDIYGDHAPGTYRCFPSTIISTNSSQNSSKSVKQIERRCKIVSDASSSLESKSCDDLPLSSRCKTKNVQRCSLNGFGNIQCSTSSFSNLSGRQTPNGIPISRQIAHEEWLREKEQRALKLKEEKRRAEKMKQENEEKIKREKEEKERKDQETFMRWIERKKHEEAVKQEVLRRELELQKRLKDIEDKAVVAKTICLRQWARKKEEDHKAQQKQEQLKQQQKEEEKKKRLEESSKAYHEWREKSKLKPKPATQGLLPHQTAKPAFVNPNPWQNLIEIDQENSESTESIENEKIMKPQKRENKKEKSS